ncbi:MAG: helix-turn-helix domain-containing protein [Pseudomonadota bacterium]
MKLPLYTRKEPLLLPYFPQRFYLALRDRGFDDTQIFAGMDFGSDELQDQAYRLTIEQHEQFILRMLDLTEDPHFALRLVDTLDTSTTNLPMLTAAHSGRVGNALHVIARYSKIITRVYTVSMRDDVDLPGLELAVHVEHDRVTYFAVSSLALFLNRFFQDVLNGDNLVRCMKLAINEPDDFYSVRALFPFDVVFSQSQCAIDLHSHYLDFPVRQADAQTVALLTNMAEQQLSEAEAETSLLGAVKLLLLDQLAAPPKLDDAAHMLNLSPRSLRRKLAESGTTYQGILDSVRLTLAKRLLRETDTPFASIAYELGFNNPSDFGRAFKKWSGQPPSMYRRGN